MTHEVEQAIGAFEPEVQRVLRDVRQLVQDVARTIPEIDRMDESLKWGEPSFAPTPKTGTPIRIGVGKDGRAAVFVHCQTSLVADLAADNPHALETKDNRSVVIPAGDVAENEGMRGFIRAALTYFL